MSSQLLPQPPPYAPSPPPSDAALLSRSKLKWLVGIGGIAIFSLFALLSLAPLFLRSANKGHKFQAVSNMRQTGLAMFEFEIEYGTYPSRETIARVKAANPESKLSLLGETSNDYFSQLLAADIAQSEDMFYAMSKSSKKRPDNVHGLDSNTLLQGDTPFAYIAGLDSTMPPETPLVFAPVIPGTKILDRKIYHGKAVVLGLDNSVRPFIINADGNIQFPSGKLLDLRKSTFDGKPVDIKWPK